MRLLSGGTTELQIVQGVGSTLGAALFAVILEQRITVTTHGSGLAGTGRAVGPGLGAAFAGTFWWGFGLSALALIPTLFLCVATELMPSVLHEHGELDNVGSRQ